MKLLVITGQLRSITRLKVIFLFAHLATHRGVDLVQGRNHQLQLPAISWIIRDGIPLQVDSRQCFQRA